MDAALRIPDDARGTVAVVRLDLDSTLVACTPPSIPGVVRFLHVRPQADGQTLALTKPRASGLDQIFAAWIRCVCMRVCEVKSGWEGSSTA